ncbi:cyclase family protein [Paenibacillus sp. GSMTC-2017]|uniref:cyclase family protein n=1 Tax=Paenibacillus sp. GSMTC-2017 TaxID=2794350 RepID=UPI0018D88079|nr:cyclase family protein [Paenibacillus sp. GSMTC-2017]MBH5320342.1 cyclase family protein [Paenibacillus sp. GSMTC-2017]
MPYGKLPEPLFTAELISLIRSGKVYSLQHVLERGIPVFEGHAPFRSMPYIRHSDTEGMLKGSACFASELTMMGQHTGTHIDALCHFSKRVGDERYFYGGETVSNAESHEGISKWSIEQMPPIIARGILLDVPRALGVDVLEDSYEITIEDIKRCEERQGVEIVAGSCVLTRTGFSEYWKKDNLRFLNRHAGVGLEAAKYVVEKGAIAVGSDTSAFEVLPTPSHEVHTYLLVEQGVPIMECLDLEQLAGDQSYEFVIIVTPLKLKGATASVIHPIAIA